jgi:signal-transduction protein with cAMP-binding, CBS, and nucleotidyltransferase domain
MSEKNLNKFFLSIVVPTILAIVLFIISFFVVIIPQFEKNMMDRKKEMIRELTNTAWSILEEHQIEYKNGNTTLDSAKANAARQIEQMRYGAERKDYFWIIDYSPRMMMHPYRKELNGTNLTDFKDSHEKKLFVDAAKLVKENGEGFIDYYWQWKDDTSRVVPKLSYVKGFEEWQWVVGTGIYLDDVNKEIAYLKNRLFTISASIIAIIILTLVYVIRQSLSIENKRKTAEKELLLSNQKYKTLVHASTEGTLMFVNNKVIFNNLKFAEMYDCPSKELSGLSFNDIFSIEWSGVLKLFTDPKKTVTTETRFKCDKSVGKDVVISVSHIDYSNQDGFIVIAKDVSKQKQLEKSSQMLSQELQTSLLLMNQPIKSFVQELITCNIDTTIKEAATLMTTKNQKVVYVKKGETIIGAINDTDLKKRVLAQGVDLSNGVTEIMSSPVVQISENALLYEAVLLFKHRRVSHLLVKDSQNKIIGTISNQNALEMQRNSLSYLVQEIETSQHIEELKLIYNRVPVLVNAIISNSDNAQNTTRIITSVADAITTRVIDLAIESHGPPPCPFAFMAMGSEGRMEQTLKTDQDNAIVISDSHSSNDIAYFLNLAETINKNLHKIGYNYCKGEVMASNKKWCQPIKSWKEQFSYWIQSPDPQNVLDSSIFFDFRSIYGEESLIRELRDHVNSEVKQNELFFYHMSNSIINFKTTIDSDNFDIKKVLLPLVGFVRIHTLNNQLNQTNTIERLEVLTDKHIFVPERRNELLQIYNFLMQLRLKYQAISLLENESPENIIEYKNLSHIEQNTLKKSHKEISELQLELSLSFKRMT